MHEDGFKLGIFLGIVIGVMASIMALFESDQSITPGEFSFYDEYCLKYASTTKYLSIDIDDAILKCHNGTVFEFNREDFKGDK